MKGDPRWFVFVQAAKQQAEVEVHPRSRSAEPVWKNYVAGDLGVAGGGGCSPGLGKQGWRVVPSKLFGIPAAAAVST